MNKEESKKCKVPHEIELMEQVAKRLDKWARDKSAVLSTLSDDKALATFRRSMSKEFYQILEWLEWHKPHVAKQIKELFDSVEHLGETKNTSLPDDMYIFAITLPIKVLASKLRYIAKMIRDNEEIQTAGLQHIAEMVAKDLGTGKAVGKEAYIPFSKAVEFSNGIITRKKLEKAINKGIPITVRSYKPNKQRKKVHIQDVLSLIKKLSDNEDIVEKATQMFAKYKDAYLSKRPAPNLD